MKKVEINCENNNCKKEYPLGTTLLEIAEDLKIELKAPVCGAMVNNKLKELSFSVVKSKTINFVDLHHADGRRMYIRSLLFVFYAAVRKLFPDVDMYIKHGISNGYYAEMKNMERKLNDDDISMLRSCMWNIIEANYPFEKRGLLTDEVVKILNEQGLERKARLFEQQNTLYSYIYFMDGLVNYFYGHLLPSTGYVTNFGLELYHEGILIQTPNPADYSKLQETQPRNKLFEIYQEHKDWAKILEVMTISDLNEIVDRGKIGDIIKISEALHEKKISEIANRINHRRDHVRIVLVAGPSSSGKTTFSKRLGVQLSVNGMKPHMISLDDYFVDREHTPLNANGEYDFEALEAIDIKFFNQQLNELLEGKTVEIPRFNFQTGSRAHTGSKLRLGEKDILIIEGIHGLNPGLLPDIDPKLTFKVFLSALTQISVDEHTHVSTSDNRLIRRMIRDSQYRGYSAIDTIKRWPLVREGEEKHIFPYQENADAMFNSATLYELSVLKNIAEPLLQALPEKYPEYSESSRLLKFLSYINPSDGAEIPPTSIVREFLGGSSFEY